MNIFARIAERRIREAMENGEFDNLEGMGKPITFEDETMIPEDLRMVYRILKNAGCIPPEVELRNEVVNMSALINTIDDDKERLKKIREFNFKLLRLNIMRKRPFSLDDFPEYEFRVADKLTGGL
ncbi:MAG TPA: DnaJ family domain-containing protein [Thermodesulfovibrionales bacterium]|nr:DnaJ family domain-containing protein [Thermodesulfovibrionales bacterium]